jgi:hypothetical protein
MIGDAPGDYKAANQPRFVLSDLCPVPKKVGQRFMKKRSTVFAGKYAGNTRTNWSGV